MHTAYSMRYKSTPLDSHTNNTDMMRGWRYLWWCKVTEAHSNCSLRLEVLLHSFCLGNKAISNPKSAVLQVLTMPKRGRNNSPRVWNAMLSLPVAAAHLFRISIDSPILSYSVLYNNAIIPKRSNREMPYRRDLEGLTSRQGGQSSRLNYYFSVFKGFNSRRVESCAKHS